MSKKKIHLSTPHMSREGYELKFINDAFEKNWIAPEGENVREFEQEIMNMMDVKGAVALVNGTSAIHLALKAAGVEKDDIVLCQNLTFCGSAFPVIYQGARPVFVGSDKKTWNMSPKSLEEAFKKYPEAKAVIAVSLYGFSADYDALKEICKKNKAVLIEDAAESLGGKYKGKASGTLGDMGIYSFNGNKIITTSQGGMVVSNDKASIDKVRHWSHQSRDNALHYQHSELGYNYSLSNVSAGIGRGQLKVLQERLEKKKFIYEFYKRELSGLEGISFIPINDWDEPNYWLTCITIESELKPLDIIEKLSEVNVESRPLWKPMKMQPYFSDCAYVGEGIEDELFEHGLCLPSDTKMSEADLTLVCEVIKSLWKKQ